MILSPRWTNDGWGLSPSLFLVHFLRAKDILSWIWEIKSSAILTQRNHVFSLKNVILIKKNKKIRNFEFLKYFFKNLLILEHVPFRMRRVEKLFDVKNIHNPNSLIEYNLHLYVRLACCSGTYQNIKS